MANIVYNNIIPFKGFKAITVMPFVFARKKFKPLDDVTLNHEGIHLRQQLEVLIVAAAVMAILCLIVLSWWWMFLSLGAYYILYCTEYFIKLCAYGRGHEAYRNISFEQEAFMHERNLSYLDDRKAFAWLRYITKKTYRR